jgi:signal peptidase I
VTAQAFRKHPVSLRERPRTVTFGRLVRLICWTVFVAALAAWAIFLRPGFLGGRATYVIVAGHSMEPTLRTGDLVVTLRQRTYRRGDVIAYHIGKGQPGAGLLIIHRIVGGSAAAGYMTKGDNRRYRDPWRPKPREIDGKRTMHVPRFGVLTAFAHTSLGVALFGALAAFLVLRGGTAPRARSEEAPPPEELGAAVSDDGWDDPYPEGVGDSADELEEAGLRAELPQPTHAGSRHP